MNRRSAISTRLLKGAGFALTALFATGASAGTEDQGKALFEETCLACHGEGGIGTAGIAPPLVDPPLWSGLGNQAPLYFAGVVANGLSGRITVLGQDYIGLVMPSQAAVSDADLGAIGSYVLKELNALPIGPDDAMITAAKATPTSHKALRALRANALSK